MKKNIYKILCLLTILISLSTFIYVKADSGWDTDYGSGSSSSYGGSSSYSDTSSWSAHDYRSSSSRSNSSSGGYIHKYEKADKVKVFLFFLLTFGSWLALPVFVYILSILFSKNKNNDNQNKRNSYYDVTNEIFIKYFDCDINVLKKQLYDNFYNVQMSRMNFDYDNLRKLCTDELYNQYKTQLEVARLKNEKNIMSDFTLNNIKIYRISEINNVTIVNVFLDVTFKDYVINNDSKDIVRGDDKIYVNNCYLLEFSKTNKSKIINCPSCGANVEVISSNVCPHCKNRVVQTSNQLVLSRKKIISSNKSNK